MADEEEGEWKLLKVWECRKCKILIRDGRKVYDHKCNIEEQERTEKEEQERREIIEKEEQERRERIEKEEQERRERIEKEEQERRERIEKEEEKEEQERRERIEKEEQERRERIEKEEQERREKEELERREKEEQDVYVEESVIGENGNESISVDIWKDEFRIKDSKDIGYRTDIEIEVFERGKGKERIIIKNGKVIKKPDDIDIIGKNTPNGFIIQGVHKKPEQKSRFEYINNH